MGAVPRSHTGTGRGRVRPSAETHTRWPSKGELQPHPRSAGRAPLPCGVGCSGPEISAALTAGGRTSTAVTLDAVTILETPQTPVYARRLIAARRYAEAYELLYRLLDAVVEPDACARELTWICEHWDRVEEANVLRFNYGSLEGEQLALF